MTIRFIYSTEPSRVISASIIDAKSTIPSLVGKNGVDTKAYIDTKLNLVQQESALVYKMETMDGNMIGVIALSVDNTSLIVTKILEVVRTNYTNMYSEISSSITNFITGGGWRPDFLT
jgi:hypothetical protein